MATLVLEELNARNISAANSLTLKQGQERFVAPLSYSMAEPFVNQATAWPRVVLEDGKVVGFIQGNFDPEADREEFRCCIWRINVSAEAQGHGIGRFAVEQLADEARRRGFQRVTVIYEAGDQGPEQFFLRIGFTPIGETDYGEVIAALDL